MVYPKTIFLKCQILDDSDLLQACLKSDYSKLKESLLDGFDINLNTREMIYFYSDELHSDSLKIIMVNSDESFIANSFSGDDIKKIKEFL